VAGLRRFHTIYCKHGREALIHLYAGDQGTIVELRCRVMYAGTPALDFRAFANHPNVTVTEKRLPDYYWLLLEEWDGPALPTMECAHGVREIDWKLAATGRISTV
jgi:hypothetical protein